MVGARGTSVAIALLLAAVLRMPAPALGEQNQSPQRPQPPGQPAAGNQPPAAPGNQSPPAPQPPLAIPLYISPGAVLQIQQKLLALGLPVPTVSGSWGDNSAAALRVFQSNNGLDAGGDLDELTLLALGMPDLLRGDAAEGVVVSAQAAATGGAQLHASPRLTRVVQAKLTEAGFPTDNVFGVWLAGSETAVRNFQKAKALDLTGSLDLRLLHQLGLTASLTEPKPGKLPTDSPAQVLSEKAVPFTGAPLTIGPVGVRQIQAALQQRGFKDAAGDGRWSERSSAALKKFQEAQKLEATGSVNLRTLRALGFTNPLTELDQPTAGPPKTTK
jgi:peptidoglycan hydrolase-like protein with peptidoglycan-binding domain